MKVKTYKLVRILSPRTIKMLKISREVNSRIIEWFKSRNMFYDDNFTYDDLEKSMRRKIAEECRDEIWNIVYYETNSYKQAHHAVDKIMEIIRG